MLLENIFLYWFIICLVVMTFLLNSSKNSKPCIPDKCEKFNALSSELLKDWISGKSLTSCNAHLHDDLLLFWWLIALILLFHSMPQPFPTIPLFFCLEHRTCLPCLAYLDFSSVDNHQYASNIFVNKLVIANSCEITRFILKYFNALLCQTNSFFTNYVIYTLLVFARACFTITQVLRGRRNSKFSLTK